MKHLSQLTKTFFKFDDYILDFDEIVAINPLIYYNAEDIGFIIKFRNSSSNFMIKIEKNEFDLDKTDEDKRKDIEEVRNEFIEVLIKLKSEGD